MSRIAKADVNQALIHAANLLKTAGGADGRVSRADVQRALPTLPPAERALVDAFYRFAGTREVAGGQITRSDLDAAVEYAKTELIAKYDLNNNGLSAAEIATLGEVGKLAVELAKLLKTAPIDDDEPIAPPRIDEGLSEPDEILAAGQVPRDWTPEVSINAGTLTYTGDKYDGFQTSAPLTPVQREVANAAFEAIWDRHLKHRAEHGQPLDLRNNGFMKVGEFTRPDDGKTYLVADWRDIDDGSFTLYFERLASGKLRLAIEQFNN